MTSLPFDAPWHKESFDRFLNESLPALLAARLLLAGYRAEETGPQTRRVTVSITSAGTGDVTAAYDGIPYPDADGAFLVDGVRRTGVVTASTEDLDRAEIKCVGEHLYDYIEARLGKAPASGLAWDEALLRVFLPLDAWVRDFFVDSPMGHYLDPTNWLAGRTHLRRLVIPDRERVVTPGQFGRVDPFETPEGPNIGRVFTLARGAAIRNGRIEVFDASPEAGLGLGSSTLPFLEHSEAARVLMGVNMMRQWLVPPDYEPALVQTGNEPPVPEFWCGRNLLTAFVSWGADTHEDGLVISRSCAARLGYPHPVEPGDKLSNRHGTKGVVSRILPDEEMPHLPDGTPVEIAYSFTGLPSRMNFGQIREAVLGRIARAEGQPAIVPPYHSPSASAIKERLRRAGLPESGMERLTQGKGGAPLEYPSTVGWVYWGRLVHTAVSKIRASASVPVNKHPGESDGWDAQRVGVREYGYLRDLGATATLRALFDLQAAERIAIDGEEPTSGPPAPKFASLQRRLAAAAGIRAELSGGRMTFRWAAPEEAGETLRLARPNPHPWLRERPLIEVGAFPGPTPDAAPEWEALVKANERLGRLLAEKAPESLTGKAGADLEERAASYFDVLLAPEHLRPGNRVLFSGRAVVAPGPNLCFDQVALPDEMAWTLFGPLLVRETGDAEAAAARSESAAKALDDLMARSWVLLNRAPTLALLAFRPVRDPDRVVRIHPLVCGLLDADFDGDQIAVFLPLGDAAQKEAGERLSVAAHLTWEPGLLRHLLAGHAMLWGLARLSLTPEGRAELADLIGAEIAYPEGFLTKAVLHDAVRIVLERDGAPAALAVIQRLMERGFAVAKASGASMGPFFGETLDLPAAPPDRGDLAAWEDYGEEVRERLATRALRGGEFADPDLGPMLLSAASGARANLTQLAKIIAPWGVIPDLDGAPLPVRHGWRDGLTPEELRAHAAASREALANIVLEYQAIEVPPAYAPQSLHVLGRAVRSRRPGVVFALAAASGASDPLTDADSRLFVGLPAE